MLTDCSIAGAAAQHMFCLLYTSRKLPALRTLRVAECCQLLRNPGPGLATGARSSRLLLQPGDLSRLVSSCSAGSFNLHAAQALMLAEDVSAADVAPLLQLPLSFLVIGGPGLDDSVAEQVLARMTGACVKVGCL